jgi:hypothetical protein
MEIEATLPATSVEIGSKSGGHHWVGERGWNEQVATGFTAVALASAHTDEEVAEGFGGLKRQVAETNTNTVVGFKEQLATAYQIEGRAMVEASKNAAAAQLEAAKNFAATQVEASKNAAATALAFCENTDKIMSQAAANAAAISAQLAECCCQLKELIREDGDKTRSLINDLEVQRLRAQLVATQRLVPVTIPVGA